MEWTPNHRLHTSKFRTGDVLQRNKKDKDGNLLHPARFELIKVESAVGCGGCELKRLDPSPTFNCNPAFRSILKLLKTKDKNIHCSIEQLNSMFQKYEQHQS